MTDSDATWSTRLIIIVKKTGWAILFVFSFILLHQLIQLWVSTRADLGEAPNIQAVTLTGEPFVMQETRGKPLLLHFWATWCGICRLEHHSITRLARDYQVMTVAVQSGSNADIQQDMHTNEAVYPVINDNGGELMQMYGIRGVPNSFVIDSQGNVDSVLKGYTTEAMLRYRLWRLDSE